MWEFRQKFDAQYLAHTKTEQTKKILYLTSGHEHSFFGLHPLRLVRFRMDRALKSRLLLLPSLMILSYVHSSEIGINIVRRLK